MFSMRGRLRRFFDACCFLFVFFWASPPPPNISEKNRACVYILSLATSPAISLANFACDFAAAARHPIYIKKNRACGAFLTLVHILSLVTSPAISLAILPAISPPPPPNISKKNRACGAFLTLVHILCSFQRRRCRNTS